jgi:CubicO group peptidase (beta-lactamase class C family)
MNNDLSERLAAFVIETMERLQVPGVALGITDNGDEYSAAFGITSIQNPLPVTVDTLFQIGSTSKTFTATLMMKLVERGEVDLYAPVRKYLPEFALRSEDDAAKARVIDCLSHVGGWAGDYFRDTGRGEDALAKMVERLSRLPQLTPCGEVFSYNNAGFYVAGRIIEVVTGQPFEMAMRSMVLEPLGLEHTYFSQDDLITYRVAAGHIVMPEGPHVTRPWRLSVSVDPAGGLVSDVHDQLAYARFHMGDGTAPDGSRFLERSTLDQMKQPVHEAGSMCDEVGVSWLLRKVGDVQLVQHGGATNGQMAAFTTIPERQFAFTILTNANRGSELHALVGQWILENIAGISSQPPELLELPVDRLAEYAGRYGNREQFLDLKIDGGRLTLQAITTAAGLSDGALIPPPFPPVELSFYAEDKAMAFASPYGGARGEFLRGGDGRIEWFRWGGRINPRADGEA